MNKNNLPCDCSIIFQYESRKVFRDRCQEIRRVFRYTTSFLWKEGNREAVEVGFSKLAALLNLCAALRFNPLPLEGRTRRAAMLLS